MWIAPSHNELHVYLRGSTLSRQIANTKIGNATADEIYW